MQYAVDRRKGKKQETGDRRQESEDRKRKTVNGKRRIGDRSQNN